MKFVLNPIRLLPLVVLCISIYGSVFANTFEKSHFVSNDSGSEELFLATLKGDTEKVERLLKRPFITVDVNYKVGPGTTPMMVASAKGFTDIVELLLDRYYKFLVLRTRKADVNLQDDMGRTALMYASMYGYSDIVSLLLDQDEINVNVRDDEGRTALIYASTLGARFTTPNFASTVLKAEKIRIINELISHDGEVKIDVNIQDNLELTALMYVVLEGELKEAVEMLLNHKDTNTQLKNTDENTIFDFDMDYNPEVLELLNKHLRKQVSRRSLITRLVE